MPRRSPARGESSPSELEQLCSTLPGALSTAFGREVGVHRCELAQVGGRRSVFLDFDGAVAGTRSLQYQVPASESVALAVTATFREENDAVIWSELVAIMATFTIE